MVDYYYQGDMGLSNKRLILYGLILFMLIFPIAWTQHLFQPSPHLGIYDRHENPISTPEVILNCDTTSCINATLLILKNEGNVNLLVNASYTCNCTVHVTYQYFPVQNSTLPVPTLPQIITIVYLNGTTKYQYLNTFGSSQAIYSIPPSQPLVLIVYAERSSGSDSVHLNIRIVT